MTTSTLPSSGATESRLAALTLPSAPPVVRATSAPAPRRRWPAVVLLLLGAALVLGPIAGGLFTKVASGQQMIDAFAPHMTPDALGRYDDDLATLKKGSDALDQLYADQHIAKGAYPGADDLRTHADAINAHATSLLNRIEAAQPDYAKVSDIGGFDRVPFLLVTTGLALAYAGAVLLGGRRQRSGGAAALALVAAAALVAYPLLTNLPSGTRAGERLQDALAPVMTHTTVRQQQADFVVLVHAVGELDTSFRAVTSKHPSPGVSALVKAWPAVSSDLASLVGAINDNIGDYQALEDLDDLGSPVGTSGLVALPWFLVGAGAISALAAGAALSRPRNAPRKATP